MERCLSLYMDLRKVWMIERLFKMNLDGGKI